MRFEICGTRVEKGNRECDKEKEPIMLGNLIQAQLVERPDTRHHLLKEVWGEADPEQTSTQAYAPHNAGQRNLLMNRKFK